MLFHKKSASGNSAADKSVSVIICAKNESHNLQKNIPLILNQQHPAFEVIVVDDGSDDDLSFLKELNDTRLKLITLTKSEKTGLGKKYALQKGIEASSHPILLLTDADCRPVSKNWITEITAGIDAAHRIILGISPYNTVNSFLNSLIGYETAQTALQYTGLALLGRPYMSVGRNVAYAAQLLKSKVWTKPELAIASGDDDLVIQSLANNRNTAVCLTPESYTLSDAKTTWKDWINQKLRHYESGSLYKFADRAILGTYLTSKLIFYGILLYFIIQAYLLTEYPGYSLAVFLIYLIYLICILFFNLLLQLKFKLNSRWYLAGIHDLLYTVFTLFLGTVSRFKSAERWK
jgi:poly-beta-1,6-N-acetyl-D-glucosamine synthase